MKVNDNLIDDYYEVLDAVGGDDSKQVKLGIIKNGKVESYELKKKMIEKYNLR